MTDREKLLALLNAMTAFANSNPEMTNEQVEEYEKMEKEFDALDAKIKRDENREAREKKMQKATTNPLKGASENNSETSTEYIDAFLAYAKGRDRSEYSNVLSTVTGEDGGFLVPDEWASSILMGLKTRTHMRKFAKSMTTTGTFNIPIAGTKPTFGWIDELGTYPKTDAKFTNKTLEAHKAGGIIQVSEELLADEQFNLESHINELTEEALSVLEGTAFLVGDGVKKPLGVSKSIPTENTKTTSATDVVTLDDVEDLYLAVKSGYRKNGSWIISDKFFRAVFKMKNADGDRIWSAGLTDNEEGRIFNKPYEVDDTLTGEAGEPLAFFGDVSYYQIGDRGSIGLRRLDELYAGDGMVGFKIYKRTDGKLTIEESMAMLVNKE